MKSRWSTFACIGVLTGTTGFLVGFLTTLNPDPLPDRPDWSSTASRDGQPSLIKVPDDELPSFGDGNSAEELMYFPETVLAEAEALAPEEAPPQPPRVLEPGILPQPSSIAAPLSPDLTQRSGLEQLIDAEFGGLSQQQREVWIEVLSGLPLEDAAGILRTWKQLGRGAEIEQQPGLIGANPGLTRLPPVNTHAADPHDPLPNHPELHALRRIRELLVLNLLNADTHGYRRYEPLLSDTSIDEAAPHSVGVSFDGWRIDQRPGTIQPTGNSLDVAISGAGFFVVMVDGETFYTRCGRFGTDDQGRLMLDQPQHTALLHPEVIVPPGSVGVLIDLDGTVHVGGRGEESRQLGQLQLATFRDPGRLRPVGGTLFQATADSGPATLHTPNSSGAGSVQHRVLETSNVDLERERSRLECLDRLLQTWE